MKAPDGGVFNCPEGSHIWRLKEDKDTSELMKQVNTLYQVSHKDIVESLDVNQQFVRLLDEESKEKIRRKE